jgi:hypothetical protein
LNPTYQLLSTVNSEMTDDPRFVTTMTGSQLISIMIE